MIPRALLLALVVVAPQSAAVPPVIDWLCGTGLAGERDGPAAVAARQALWLEQSPGVLTPDYHGNVELTIAYSADVPALRVFRAYGASYVFDEFPRTQTRTIGGVAVDLFQVSWPFAEFIRRFGFSIDFDSGQSGALFVAPASVPLRSDGFPTQYSAFSIRAMSRGVGTVPVVRVDDTAQYSSHVVNLVLPGLAETPGPADFFDERAAARRFYGYMGDDYDVLAFVFREKPFRGSIAAYHSIIRNEISGIGSPLINLSAQYGSAGRLKGSDVYLNQLGNIISNHELSHQWGHYYNWLTLAGISRSDTAHTPIWGHHESPIPSLVPPWLRLIPQSVANTWQFQYAPEPTRAPPLQAYAMGRLAAADVPPVQIFEDQNLNYPPGLTLTAATRSVSINQIVAAYGPRQGPVVESLRRATVLISRERLASQREMDYWTLFAQRLEDPHRTGMVSMSGIGSFDALTGARLQTALVLPAGQSLPGHAEIEPTAVSAGDLPGLTLNDDLKVVVPTQTIVRWRGRVDDAALRAAYDRVMVGYHHGQVRPGASQFFAPIAADGTFEISGAVTAPVGRGYIFVELWRGTAVSTPVADVLNVRYLDPPAAAPAPPVSLSANVTVRTVSLQWQPDAGPVPQRYWVEFGSSPGASNLGRYSTTSTTFSVPNVPDGRYFVRVRAENGFGFSTPSAEVSLIVPGCGSLSPPVLSGSVTGALAAIAWTPAPAAGFTSVVAAGSVPGASDIAQVAVGAATSLQAVVPPRRYYVRVRRVSPCGTAVESNEIRLDVGVPPPPAAPTALAFAVNGSTVVLAWQPAAGVVSGYIIEGGSAPGLANLAVLPIGPVSAYTAGGVPPGTYFVRVRASNAGGPGPPSNEVAIVVP